MITNYHTHTYRCKHADGEDRDYVEAAITCGFTEIGFTDHTPWPVHPFETPRIRMGLEELDCYVSSIRELQKEYADRIKIYVGLEAEFFEDRRQWLEQTVAEYQLDYLVFGNHFYQFDMLERYFGRYQQDNKLLQHYLEISLKGLGSGLFKIFAHPDLFMRAYPQWDDKCQKVAEEICKKAKEMNVFLEYNLGGARSQKAGWGGYPDLNFWKIVAESGCPSVIGIDAHNPHDYCDEYLIENAENVLKELGVNLYDQIEIKEAL